MNKTMMQMMKPIPQHTRPSRADLRRRQEEHVLAWLQGYPNSANRYDVAKNCPGIPGVSDSETPNYLRLNSYRQGAACSQILKRLEKKGHVVSVLYSDGYRYYSVPMNGGEN